MRLNGEKHIDYILFGVSDSEKYGLSMNRQNATINQITIKNCLNTSIYIFTFYNTIGNCTNEIDRKPIKIKRQESEKSLEIKLKEPWLYTQSH